MIKTLDRYLLRKFHTALGATILSFTVIVFVVDFVERGWRIIQRYDVPGPVIIQYYINYLPFYIILAFPVAMLVSTLFAIGSLARHRELDVMKASGLSLYRIAMPVLISAFVISIGVMFFTEFVLTATEKRKDEIKNYLIEKRPPVSKISRHNIKVPGENGWIVLGSTYDVSTMTGTNIKAHRIVKNKIVQTYSAAKMAASDSGWVLINGSSQEFSPNLSDSVEHFYRFDTL